MPPRPMNDEEVLSEMNKMVRLRMVSHIYDADALPPPRSKYKRI
jgi:hypothetical protein